MRQIFKRFCNRFLLPKNELKKAELQLQEASTYNFTQQKRQIYLNIPPSQLKNEKQAREARKKLQQLQK
jgi:hypothetical protein